MKNYISKATVIGWHNSRNIGDEANLICMKLILKNFFNISSFYIMCSKKNRPHIYNKDLIPILSNYKLINLFFKNFFLKRKVFISDLVIFGPGGVFRSKYSLEKKIRILEAANKNAKIIAMGISLETELAKKDVEYKKKLKYFFNKLNFTLVRDLKSFKLLKKLNIKNVRYANDFSFVLPHIINTKKKKNNNNKILGVSFCNWYNNLNDTDLLLNKIYNLIKCLILKYSLQEIYLFSFSESAEDSDTKYLIKLKSKILLDYPNVKIALINKDINFSNTYKKISICDAFIGMRLHSQIFSIINNIPLIAIDYEEKVRNFYHSNKYKKVFIFNPDLDINYNKVFNFLDANLYKKKSIKKLFIKDYNFIKNLI
jgi:polysaccharide pyruvyl transferase WcaK-like protein